MLQLVVSTCTNHSIIVQTEHNVKHQLLVFSLHISATSSMVVYEIKSDINNLLSLSSLSCYCSYNLPVCMVSVIV